MRKTAVIVVALLLLLSLCGCGVIKEKIAGKVSEKVTEGFIEKAIGDDVDVDLDMDEGTIKFKDDEGGEVTMGGAEWPKDGAGALIPKFKKGKIDSVLNSPGYCQIDIEDVKLADYEQYIKELKKAGITDDPMEYDSGDSVGYSATRGEELRVEIGYSDDGTMGIFIQAAD